MTKVLTALACFAVFTITTRAASAQTVVALAQRASGLTSR